MSGISRYEKVVLGLTAAFLLFTGGWFLGRQNAASPYEVTTAQNGTAEDPAQSMLPSESVSGPDSLLEGETIDLNEADVYTLQRLPGIGEKRAQAIVAFREEHGPFETKEEIMQVSGIGEGKYADMKERITVEETE